MKRIGLFILVLALLVAGVFVLNPGGGEDSGLIDEQGANLTEETQGASAGLSGLANEAQPSEADAHPGLGGLTEGGRSSLAQGAAGRIQGRVLDALSEPVAGIQIFLHRRSDTAGHGSGAPILARARSDEQGVFRLEGLEFGHYSLRAVGEGWAQTMLAVQLSAQRPKRAGLILRLQEGYGLTGVVVDSAGKGLAGAWILARNTIGQTGETPFQEVRSDAQGHFSFASLPGGKMHVLAWAEGRMLGSAQADASKSEPIRVELAEEGPFEMIFSLAEPKDGSGSPPTDVLARLHIQLASVSIPLPGPLRELRVPSKGEIRIRGLCAGSYQIPLRSSSVILDKTWLGQTLNEEKTTARLVLAWHPAVGLEGRLIYKNGQAAAGIPIQTWITNPREPLSVVTDEKGHFVFPKRFNKTGSPWIVLTEPGLVFESGKNRSLWTRLRPGQKDNVFTVLRVTPISGRVVDDKGHPVADARVWLHAKGQVWRQYGQTNTDDQGEFQLVMTQRSQSPVVLEAAFDASWCENPLILNDGGKVAPQGLVIRLSQGSWIEGMVVDEKGKGIAQASVWASFVPKTKDRKGGTGFPGRMQRRTRGASTNAEGRFRILGIAPGAWKVTCRSAGRRMLGTGPTVQVARGKNQGGVRLVLQEGLSIEGRMVTANGKPFAGAWINARFDGKLAQGETGGRAQTQTAADGSFKLTGLRPGNFVLTSYPSWQMQKELGLRKPGPDGKTPMQQRTPMQTKVMAGIKDYRWQVLLPSFGEIRVRLAHSGQALQQIKVRFQAQKQSWTFDVPVHKGLVTMKHVLTGSYELTFQSPRFEDQKIAVQVSEGQVMDLGTLSLADLAEVEGRVTDKAGQPLAGVWIGLDNRLSNLWQTYDISKGPEQFGGRVLTQSDSRGRFIVPIKGRLRVYGFKPGYAPRALSWTAPKPAKQGQATQEPVLVLERAGEITIEAPTAAKGQRTRWFARLTRIPATPPPAGKKAPRPWSRNLRLQPGKRARYIGLQAGRYRLEVIDFMKTRKYAQKTVPGESYYEELLIQTGSHRLIRIP